MTNTKTELNNTEKRVLLTAVVDRARADLNDGKPLTEMRRRQSRSEMTEEQREMFIDASTLAYMGIRFSGLWKQLSSKEWDDMADELGERLVDHLNSWIDAEITRRNTADEEMDSWLKSKD